MFQSFNSNKNYFAYLWSRYEPTSTALLDHRLIHPLVNEKYNACRVDSVNRNGCAGR